MALKDNYKNQIIDLDTNPEKRYWMIQNDDGTVSFRDATVYTQDGDKFGAADVNKTNTQVNKNEANITELITINNACTFDPATGDATIVIKAITPQ